MTSLLIKGGTLFDVERPLGTGDILVVDGIISAIGDALDAPGVEILDARGRIVMPGLINAHTHSNQALEKGLCDLYPLDAWMVLASYGGANAELSPRDLYVSAQIGAIEMLRTGTTAAIDMPRIDLRWFAQGSDAIMQAYADIGLRAGVAVSFTDLDFASSLPLELVPGALEQLKPRRTAAIDDVLSHAGAFLARWQNRNPLLRPMIGPSSLPRCSTELFEGALGLAHDHGVGFQTHLLSGKSQIWVGQKRYGGSTVGFLDRIGALREGNSYAHAIWLDDAEVAMFAASPAVAVHNPVSNMKLGAGLSPVPALRRAGGVVALGSDGASSQDSQNMFETIKGSALLHRNSSPQHQWITAPEALEMCWHGGAAAFGEKLGRLQTGYAADLAILDTRSLFLAPKAQLAGQLVHSELGGSVETVLVGGRVVLRDRVLSGIDEAAIHAEAQEIIARLYAGLPERMRRFTETWPIMRDLEATVNATALHFTRFCH